MAIPTVQIAVSGARGESLADISRRTGAYDVLPTDSDAVALAKYALGVALEAGVTAEADRAQAAADFAEGFSGPVYADTAAGEAATSEGQIFRVSNGDGPPETTTAYKRTASGSVELAPLATTAALSSEDEGKGVDLIGKVISPDIPNPVVLRTILTDMQVSRMLAGAGDGDTDPAAVAAETAKFHAIIGQERSFSVPEPAVTYAVNTLSLAQGQTIEGAGQFSTPRTNGGKFQFTGNGVDPVFQLGDGTGNQRMMTLRDLSAYNDGADVVNVNNAPNLILERVRLRNPGNACGINARFSYRAAIRNSWIAGNDAIRCLDNMNGLTIENVTCTGGSGGRAIVIGQSQGVRIVSNIIESSLDGIHIASTTLTGDGLCSAVLVEANYIEQCKTPLIIGKQSIVQGLTCVSNYIGNSNASNISAREAAIQFGRIRGGEIANNIIYPVNKAAYPAADDEDIFWIWLENASGGFDHLTVGRNYVNGTPANLYQLKGAQASSASVRASVGGLCNFGFMGDGNPLGSDSPSEWVSPLIDTSSTHPAATWLPADMMEMGGHISSVEIIDYDGGSLSGVTLYVGRVSDNTQNVFVADMSSLSFTRGRADLTLATSVILDTEDAIWRTGGSTAAGKFRIRIRYRAN